MIQTHEINDEFRKTLVGMSIVFIENEKSLKDQEPLDERELPQDDHDCDQEDPELTSLGDGTPSPAEIKLKIKKSLLEFRCKVEDAILGNYLLGEPDQNLAPEDIVVAREQLRGITLWGVPLLPSKAHEGTDIVLRKFLKAKDFKVSDAFDMLQKTMIWRSKNNIEGILDEDLGSEFENAGFLNGRDREARPVSYHVCGIFRDKHLYKKTFGTQQKCDKFLRWRIQLIERAIEKLSFREGGVDSIIQIYDLKNIPNQGMKELNSLSKKALIMFQNYYPELIHKSIVVYAPFWFYTSQVLFSRFMNQRNKKKFILARPQKVTQTLLKFIAPEHLPTEYGGLMRNCDQDFSAADKVFELKIKGNTVSRVEFPVNEPGVTIMWDVTVVGWDVSYKEEFIPDDEGSYNILLQNQSVVGDSTRNSFYISEPGKIVITVENGTFKKKKLFYRSKTRATIPMFILLA
ncbi:CRAL/TRIO, N-terminal domain [Sesbania bispinosa]|nr:CRAL/TRIO, N-terminal domain [Sesbania bispinosa]